MKKYFILILIQSLALVSKAQSLSGYVYELNSDQKKIPVYGATVFFMNTNNATTTDTTGFFSLIKDSVHHQLIVTYIGYANDTMDVLQTKEPLHIQLHELKTLKEVEISANKQTTYFQSMNPIGTQIITEGELKKAACCNLSESFETNPSIDVNFSDALTGTKQIKMLGLTSPYLMITEENIPSVRTFVLSSYLLCVLPDRYA